MTQKEKWSFLNRILPVLPKLRKLKSCKWGPLYLEALKSELHTSIYQCMYSQFSSAFYLSYCRMTTTLFVLKNNLFTEFKNW